MYGDMIILVALDLVLRRLRAGAMRVALVVEVACMDPVDPATDVSGFGVPRDVIADLEPLRHLHFSMVR